jgi:prepilin-type N-terminal cleavage/methylation domain-containing protein
MKKSVYIRSRGFSLIELLICVSVLVVIVTMAMNAWISFTQKTNRINSQASLDIEARRIIENFRSEMSKTSRESIIFYPRNQAPYKAVCFALPADQDGDGLIDMNNVTSNILWRQTVIYHIFNQEPEPPQMRRTVFQNRNPTATFDERYAQVESVVTAGHGTDACLPNETTSMKVMFENLFTGRLWQAEARFDGYAPVANTRERVNFGVAPIQAGTQQVVFTVVDMNPLSTGRKIGLDRIAVSGSGWPMEAELLSSASSIPKVYAGVGTASAGYGLLSATSANGEQVTLTLNNDAVEESLFIGADRNVLFSNTVVRLDAEYTPTGFGSGVLCTKIDGSCLNSWKAIEQAGGSTASWVWGLNTNYWAIIRIPILSDPALNADGEPNEYGVRKRGFNPVFRLLKSSYNGGVEIKNASFVILSPTEIPANASLTPTLGTSPEIIPLQCWQNGAVTTWSNALPRTATGASGASQIVELHSTFNRNIQIQTGSALMLQLEVKVEPVTATTHYVDLINMTRGGMPSGSWVSWCSSTNEANARMMAPTWSGGAYAHWNFGYIPFLKSMVVNYADGGDYISHPFDTTDISNKEKTMTWEARMPPGGGGTLQMYARSGNSLSANGYDIVDASAWGSLSPVTHPPPSSGVSVGTGRYVQFRTVFVSQKSHIAPDVGAITASSYPGPYHNDTPKLRWARFTWDGEKKYVEVSADLLKGPDRGIFKVTVNGQELVRGVTMEIEIFKDIRGVGGLPIRITSGISAEVDPRNSGK